ncbi:MAG: hypothetical protein GXP13_03205 [Gammaproteobacteria bacterium]|nr:hypothetical protein [Gammaproteobacteria bacterium]
MKTLFKNLITLVILSIPLASFSATLIEHEDPENSSRIWIDGSNIRIEMDRNGQYMLVDAKRNTVFIVEPAKRELIDMSEMVQQSKNTHGLKVKVDYVGKGPVIAGYSTKKYKLSVNGKQCELSLVSRQALKDTRIGGLMEKMDSMKFNPMADQYLSDCERADGLFSVKMKNLGMPLATIDQGGVLRDKVKRITKNATLPEGGFKIPSGFRRVTMQQKMRESFNANMPMGPGGIPGGANIPSEMKHMIEDMQKQHR